MSKHLRIAVMSFAHVHADSYLRILAADPRVDLVAADPEGMGSVELGRGAAYAHDLGAEYYDDYESMFASGLDAVVVCSENTRHVSDVVAAASHRVHVLCEKPLATTVADARLMIEACEQADVALMVAYPVRFSPDFVTLRDSLASGNIGSLIAASGTNNGKIPVGDRAWFGDQQLAGGGCLVDHTVHVADLVDALTELEPVEVTAFANRILHQDKPLVQVETGGIVHVRYRNGLRLVVDCSWSVPDNAPSWGGLTLDLATDSGQYHIAPFHHSVTGISAADGSQLHFSFGANLDQLMVDEFIAAIQGGRTPQPDGYAGLRTAAIVEAALASAKTGGTPVKTELA